MTIIGNRVIGVGTSMADEISRTGTRLPVVGVGVTVVGMLVSATGTRVTGAGMDVPDAGNRLSVSSVHADPPSEKLCLFSETAYPSLETG